MTDNSAMGSDNNNKLHQTAGTTDLRAAIELCADLYWLEDADGNCNDVRSFSPQTAEAARWLLQKPLTAIGQAVSPDKSGDWPQYLALKRDHQPFRQLRCLIKLGDGSACHLQISGTPRFDEHGQFPAMTVWPLISLIPMNTRPACSAFARPWICRWT